MLTAEQREQFLNEGFLLIRGAFPREDAIACLRERLDRLDAQLAAPVVVPPHGGHLTVQLALDHQTALRQADRDWLAALLQRLRTPAQAQS